MVALTTARAADLLHGSLGTAPEGEGWVRPLRFTAAQMRALGSVRAWHPGLYKQMAACTAGVRLEFETDASHVRVEVTLGKVPRGTAAVLDDVARHAGSAPDPGVVSVEVDDLPPVAMRPDERDAIEIDLAAPDDAPDTPATLPGMGRRRRVRVWLPCLVSCAVRDVSCDGGYLEAVPERDVLLVLGDSISQGFAADQPADAWPALLARETGMELLNQGIGGQVFQPGTLWGLEALDPAVIVVEFGENYRYERCAASAVGRDVRAYLSEVALAWPDTPTWVLGVPPHTEDVYPTHARSCFAEVDGLIADAAARHDSMTLVDASALLDEGRLAELLADGSDHPGTRGQEMFARRLLSVMGLGAEKDQEPPADRSEGATEKDLVSEAPIAEDKAEKDLGEEGSVTDVKAAGAGPKAAASDSVVPQLSIYDLIDDEGHAEAAPEERDLESEPVEADPAAVEAEPEPAEPEPAEPEPVPAEPEPETAEAPAEPEAVAPEREPKPAPAEPVVSPPEPPRRPSGSKGRPKKGDQRKKRASSKNHKSRRSRR